MNCNNQPEVSVIVVTYNSSKTVVETLDSIANQTYPSLELVVSDDCSTDNTVEICREWIEAHKERFVRTELLTVEKNTGVSANMNRAEAACRGEWVKPIAGDDILLTNCIDIYLSYIETHPDAVYVFAQMEFFGGKEKDRFLRSKWYIDNTKSFFESSIEEQYDFLTLVGCCIPSPTAFFSRKAVETLGVTNDERIPFMEDFPKWINLLKKNVRFHFIERKTVCYRLSDTSLCRKSPAVFEKSKAKAYIYYCFDNECKKGDKRVARLKWLRAKKTIHDGAIVWRVLLSLYKKLFPIQEIRGQQ